MNDEARPSRLFLALWPDAAVRSQLAGAMAELRRDMAGNWVKPDNLHITLAFLGDVLPARLPDIHRVADQTQGAGFTLMLDRAEFWPHNGIICLAPGVTPEPLQDLAANLARRLREAGFSLETRPYRAHLTLARKGRTQANHVPLAAPVAWKIEGFSLVESRTDRDGATYLPRAGWRLPNPKATPDPRAVG